MEFNFHGFQIKYINSNDLEVGRFKYIGCDRDTKGGIIITGVVANAVLIMMVMFVITVVSHLTNIKYGNELNGSFMK